MRETTNAIACRSSFVCAVAVSKALCMTGKVKVGAGRANAELVDAGVTEALLPEARGLAGSSRREVHLCSGDRFVLRS